ncbi:MAG: ATP-dependent Clp protease adaptor ClpS [Phycisphaerae bacterium]
MNSDSQAVAVQPPVVQATPGRAPARAKPRFLPQYRVILHNDDENTVEHVIATIILLTHLNEQDAILRTLEAHETGCALLLVTHKERAELYQEQFQSASLTVTIEPVE